jgi:lipopolysaccharide/colanic/teichoic acid biosynthesis glycosyltransferase
MSMMILPSELLQKKRTAPEPGRAYAALKRALDIGLSGVGLMALLPVFAIVALAVKLDSPGPILFAQERVGRNRRRNGTLGTPRDSDRRRKDTLGRPFKIYKFRSMVADAEKQTGPVWASAQDSRVTRLGRFLRKSRLDETPQLWNVLRGDMSLVGPRPERPFFVVSLAEAIPDYAMRYSALPGITGLAQVKSRYDSSIETVNRKLQYDLYYVRYGRLLLDLKIMAATVKVMARGEGAH